MDYSTVLSKTVQEIKPSGIRKFFDIASEMDHVISLSIGEPDFKTPWDIRKKAIHTLEKGRTWYSANSGMADLRVAISKYLERRFRLRYCPDNELLVTVGGSEAIDMSIRAMITTGDEVLIPEPCFVCYAPIVTLSGGIPVPIPTKAENAFRLTAKELKEKITAKTKLLILPFPNNPTGAVMRRNHLEEIAAVLRDTNIMILSDEIYAELTYNGQHVSIAEMDGMWERTIVVNGFSKTYAMTGWRLGYAAGPAPIIKQMTKIHQFAIMCAPTTSQFAAIEALENCDEDVRVMAEEYDERRRLIVDSLNHMGLTCFEPEGAFYVFPSIKKTGLTSEEFCQQLLMSQRVAVVPGNAFGECGEGFVRISYAASLENIIEALKRIGLFLETL
ncbi:MAG: aminotransferase class I/II-fold pyridoxal phosphate-dependent enzyme [Clostridiales bacterium]|nr:aminotransferase class I/II-fold pyridoxal phosphate-dependent enzyme [Clostridiales bacterium]